MSFARTSMVVTLSAALAGAVTPTAPASAAATHPAAVTVGAAGALNPCSLVTTAEASKAMGATSLPGKFRAGRSGTSCRWYSSDHTKNVFVQSIGAGDMVGATQLGGKPVPGIGDKAIWAAGSLFVQKGAAMMQVGLYRSAGSMQKMDPEIVALGKTAAGRM